MTDSLTTLRVKTATFLCSCSAVWNLELQSVLLPLFFNLSLRWSGWFICDCSNKVPNNRPQNQWTKQHVNQRRTSWISQGLNPKCKLVKVFQWHVMTDRTDCFSDLLCRQTPSSVFHRISSVLSSFLSVFPDYLHFPLISFFRLYPLFFSTLLLVLLSFFLSFFLSLFPSIFYFLSFLISFSLSFICLFSFFLSFFLSSFLSFSFFFIFSFFPYFFHFSIFFLSPALSFLPSFLILTYFSLISFVNTFQFVHLIFLSRGWREFVLQFLPTWLTKSMNTEPDITVSGRSSPLMAITGKEPYCIVFDTSAQNQCIRLTFTSLWWKCLT